MMTKMTKGLWIPLASVALTAAGDSAAPEIVLERMQQAQSSMTSLTAQLEQVKSFPQLGIDDPPERGRFYLSRRGSGGTRVRIEIREPVTRILTVSDGRFVLYQPRINQALEGTLTGGGKQGLFSGILTGSPQALKELELDYTVTSEGDRRVAGADTIQLRFDAREGAAVYCERIDLWVSRSWWLPVQQSCHEANQSVITFTLTEIERDVAVDEDTFELALPAGVERVKS